MNNFKEYLKEMGMPPAAAPVPTPAPVDPAMAAPSAGASPPPSTPPDAEKKELPVNGVKLINAIDLMDPDRILRYLKTIQSGVVNVQADEEDIDDTIDASNDKLAPKPDTDTKLLTAKDIINRYLFIRRIAAAAADVIRTLSSERVKDAQIESMPDLNAEKPEPPVAQPPPPAPPAPQGM